MKNISFNEGIELVNIGKKIARNGQLLDSESIYPNSVFSYRSLLKSTSKPELTFLLDAKQGLKNLKVLSLHIQHHESFVGLLRIDFFGQHRNPEKANENVPQFIKQFEGHWFDYHNHHIHFHVPGYNSLAWAIPLENDDFPIKQMDFNSDSILDAFIEFIKRINLETQINMTRTPNLFS